MPFIFSRLYRSGVGGNKHQRQRRLSCLASLLAAIFFAAALMGLTTTATVMESERAGPSSSTLSFNSIKPNKSDAVGGDGKHNGDHRHPLAQRAWNESALCHGNVAATPPAEHPSGPWAVSGRGGLFALAVLCYAI